MLRRPSRTRAIRSARAPLAVLVLASSVAAGCASRPPEPAPNLLLVVIDTLRADHTTPYGYRRDTTPALERLLADRGAVVETAYAQAPWTLPSAASYMTGRWPAELLGDGGMASYGVPEGVTGLPEALSRLGYRTAGFIANPTLHEGNGFARGFDVFYTAPLERGSMFLHGDELTARVEAWLAEERPPGPFFLYVHYLDPHDPYDNPELAAGEVPWVDPGYGGPVTGMDVHALHSGRMALADPAVDVAHLTALYDGEVRYADRQLERLLAALDPAVEAETLVVVTSDHGEELYDHGGFKHGQTLYQEQIHVPLVMRWPGHIPPRSRLEGTALLVDLYPTLLAAAGAPPEAIPRGPGIDLLPALAGDAPLPRRAAFAQHLAIGPTRAAALLGSTKLILFDRERGFEPENALAEHLWRLDRERLERVELYDLAADPAELDNLAAGRPDAVAWLGAVIDRRLAGQGGELTLLAGAVGEGDASSERLTGRIRFARAPESWTPYFLAPGDRVELDGRDLSFDLSGEPIGKGIRLAGDPGAIEEMAAALGGRPVPPGRVLIGPGRPWAGEPVPAAALDLDGGPPAAGTAGAEPVLLHLFRRAAAAPSPAAEDPETRERLKALGYL